MNRKVNLAGIEIGGTKLQLATGDDSGQIDQLLRYTINPKEGAEAIREQLKIGLKELRDLDQVEMIGVGFGGPVDWKTGTIRTSHQVSGWSDFNLAKWIQEFSGKSVAIDNDANVAALGEAKHGKGKNSERVFYITIGSGIGGGLILNGEIYHGRSPGEVEIGHLRLDKEGNTLESKCSGWAVNKKIRAYIEKEPGSVIAKFAKDQSGPEAVFLRTALDENDKDALNIINEISDDLCLALSHVVHLFHPDILVIGGGISLMGEYLRKPILEQLPRYVMKAFHPLPEIGIAALGENVVPIGALELARTERQKTITKLQFDS